jgi:hypothetical protein
VNHSILANRVLSNMTDVADDGYREQTRALGQAGTNDSSLQSHRRPGSSLLSF